MPIGRYALGVREKKKIPKGYKGEDPLVPLFPGESVIALDTEPFDDFEIAEKFRKAVDRRGRAPKVRKAKKRGRGRPPAASIPEEGYPPAPTTEDWNGEFPTDPSLEDDLGDPMFDDPRASFF